jgi:hypothetical protein
MYSTRPEQFRTLFNEKVPHDYRNIPAEDIIRMTRCKLICRHGFYIKGDLEIVRGILEYEQLREGKLRDELLDGGIFTTLEEAMVLIEYRCKEYNQVYTHSVLKYALPAPEAILTMVTR